MTPYLENYKQLIARVDALSGAIEAALGEQITCFAGCSGCCAAITVFPVEAAAMRDALDSLPDPDLQKIWLHVSESSADGSCPLLFDHRCLLYEARPLICRTHGLPIIYSADGKRHSDCCPRNLIPSAIISGANVIDLDKLNHLLVAVNNLYLSQSGETQSPERLTIAEVVTRQTQFS